MINQCSDCGGFCKKSGCERENVKPTPKRTWVDLTDEEFAEILCDDRWQDRPELMMLQVQAKLKEKNT